MDAVDSKILRLLTLDGRMTWADLAGEIGLSPPSATERVRKLEARGVIRGYAASVDPQRVGYELLAFVAVQAASPEGQAEIEAWAASKEEVQECHVVAGPYDYLLKVRCRDSAHLEGLLRRELRALAGVTRTESTIVLQSYKESARVPLNAR